MSLSLENELRILGDVRNGIEIRFFVTGDKEKEEALFKHSIKTILSEYNHEHLNLLAYTILKDLAWNGLKACTKRAFFQAHSLNLNEPADYELGVRMFKSCIIQGKMEEYENLSKELGYITEVILNHGKDGLSILVENNSPLLKEEARKIRASIYYSKEYKDIYKFQEERGDDSEGAGLGIPLIIMLLREHGFSEDYLHISSSPLYTRAEVEIPFAYPNKSQFLFTEGL
jgi:hypothetical protein